MQTYRGFFKMATLVGLEPMTSAVTGRSRNEEKPPHLRGFQSFSEVVTLRSTPYPVNKTAICLYVCCAMRGVARPIFFACVSALTPRRIHPARPVGASRHHDHGRMLQRSCDTRRGVDTTFGARRSEARNSGYPESIAQGRYRSPG